jgi:hypothetical protein
MALRMWRAHAQLSTGDAPRDMLGSALAGQALPYLLSDRSFAQCRMACPDLGRGLLPYLALAMY